MFPGEPDKLNNKRHLHGFLFIVNHLTILREKSVNQMEKINTVVLELSYVTKKIDGSCKLVTPFIVSNVVIKVDIILC